MDHSEDEIEETDVSSSATHSKLVADVQSLGSEGKYKYKHQRGEAAFELSEFGLPSIHGRLSLNELVGDSSKLGLQKVLRRIEQKKKQPSAATEPVLLKPEEEKQTRIVSYDKVKDELHKWDTVVWENRVAPTLHFPLEKPAIRPQSLKEFAEDFTPATSLESEVMALLKGGRDSLSQFKDKTSRSEASQMRRRALEEIRQRRTDLIKQRMKVAHEARKNKHRNKIKSRRYHKVLRRQKEALQKKLEENATGEEAVQILSDKLADLERKRIEERGTLRHRPGGTKFADKQKIMARFDSSARQAVENMAAISRNLTDRPVVVEGDAELDAEKSDDGGVEEAVSLKGQALENPWFGSAVPTEKADLEKPEKVTGASFAKLTAVSAAEQRDAAEFFDENVGHQVDAHPDVSENTTTTTLAETLGERCEPVLAPGLIAEAPNNSDNQRLDVAAAFAEDDVVAEFLSEKEKLADKEQPKDIDLSLPGWGEWTGFGIDAKAQKKKKKQERFTLKAAKVVRKDAGIAHVIIKEAPEKANEAIVQHQPKTVPFPFTSATEFERSLRQPMGREWVPEMNRRDLIRPRIETQAGAVIEPLDPEGKGVKKKLEELDKKLSAKQASKVSKRKSLQGGSKPKKKKKASKKNK